MKKLSKKTHYILSILLPLLPLILQIQLTSIFHRHHFFLFNPLILLVAFAFGFRCGVISTLVSALSVIFLLTFIEKLPFSSIPFAEWVAICLFLMVGFFLSWIIEKARIGEQLLRDFFESASIGFHCVGADGTILWANKAELKMLGYLAEDYIGKNITDFHADRPVIDDILCRLSSGETIYEYEARLKAKDGSVKIVSIDSSVYFEEGKFIHTRCFSRDITSQRQAEEAARTSDAQFLELANAIPQLAWIADGEGFVFWYNEKWYSYTGTTPSEMEGWGWQRVHDPKFLPEVLEKWRRSISSGNPFEMEFPLRSASGEFRVFLTRVNPIRNAEGKIIRWFGTNTDVTELQRTKVEVKKSVETLKTLLGLGQSISAELDLGKLVQVVTDTATELSKAKFGALFYNVTNEQGEAYTLYTISGVPRAAFEHFPMPRKTQVFGPTFDGEGTVRSDDITKDPRYGKNLPYSGMPKGHLEVRSYLAVPVISRSKEVIGGLFFGHPEVGIFSERDETMVQAIAAQAAVAIDNARLFQRSQNAIQMRDTFLSIASHELRTPLTSLQMQAQIRRRAIEKGDYNRFSHEKLPSLLAEDEKQIKRLTRLIDDMLDISRIQTGKLNLNPEKFDLYNLIQDVVERYSPLLSEAKCSVKLNGGPVNGSWDKYRLEQVLTNLLTNAIKYGAGSEILISLNADESKVQINISDRGIGIDEKDHARIFNQFERAVSHNGISGFGIGLFIVKQLVLAHHGTVSVESKLGHGSIFKVELPLGAQSNYLEVQI